MKAGRRGLGLLHAAQPLDDAGVALHDRRLVLAPLERLGVRGDLLLAAGEGAADAARVVRVQGAEALVQVLLGAADVPAALPELLLLLLLLLQLQLEQRVEDVALHAHLVEELLQVGPGAGAGGPRSPRGATGLR